MSNFYKSMLLSSTVRVAGMGLRDLGRLESAIATQTQNVFDEELYPSIIEKTAAIIRGIIADHPFVDGNKRTAMLTGLTLLKTNDIRFVAQAGEIEDFAVKIATAKLDIPVIALCCMSVSKTGQVSTSSQRCRMSISLI